jgi:hypothetical protein
MLADTVAVALFALAIVMLVSYESRCYQSRQTTSHHRPSSIGQRHLRPRRNERHYRTTETNSKTLGRAGTQT